jgi:hypothetical protein
VSVAHQDVPAGPPSSDRPGASEGSLAPWARPSWLPEVTAWLDVQLGALGRTVAGPIEEVKKWSISCLLRVPTTGGVVYFKAVPPLFAGEAAISQRLAALYPEDVPSPLAVDLERSWMLLEDFGSDQLKGQPLAVWEAAVRRFAEMQVSSVAHVSLFLEAGFPDRRLGQLSADFQRLLEDPLVEEALGADDVRRLRAAALNLESVTRRLENAPVPGALVHGDLHAGNVAIRDDRAVFYDWTDAAVSHPFFDLVTLLPSAAKNLPDGEHDARALRDAYLAVWVKHGYVPNGTGLDAVCEDALTAGALHHAVSYRNIVAATGQENRSEWIGALGQFLRRAVSRVESG